MLLLLLILTLAASASAAIPNRVVHDERVITSGTDSQRAVALAQARDLGVNTIRMILDGYDDMGQVEHAARQAHTAGFRLLVSISAPYWHRESYATDPAAYAAYAGWAAQRLAPLVDTYSVWNEPDLGVPDKTVCGEQTKRGTKRVRYKRTVRYRRVNAGRRLELYRRVKVKRGRKGWRKRVRGPAMRKAGRYRIRLHGKRRRLVVYRKRIFSRRVHGCQTWTSADRYRHIYIAGRAAIEAADPTAAVLLGDTSPSGGNFAWQQRLFGMVAGMGNTNQKLVADGYAHHPYDDNRNPDWGPSPTSGLGRVEQHRDLLREAARQFRVSTATGQPLPLAYTEFGYLNGGRPSWHPLTDDQIAAYLPKAWVKAERAGVTYMTQYHLWNTTIDTGNPWSSGIVSIDGTTPLPGYWALRHHLRGSR